VRIAASSRVMWVRIVNRIALVIGNRWIVWRSTRSHNSAPASQPWPGVTIGGRNGRNATGLSVTTQLNRPISRPGFSCAKRRSTGRASFSEYPGSGW
jgi:hypothetical protein